MRAAGAIGLAATDSLVTEGEGADLLLGGNRALPERGAALLDDAAQSFFDSTQFLDFAIAQLVEGERF